ncbi:vesicular-fusion protein S17 [Clydaea vesicula]|uniref:Vesicular-fusion protein S17 n=1 Tax=Clydaea vesicula TaxID=447962 RepID=A0AAD5U8A3_9FUNG|nr:vesicular-fusion protein S17 [Clydaea vesicula]
MNEDPYKILAEAEKAHSYKGWFGQNKLDEAAELYTKAANQFKLQKKLKEAGDCFLKQADCCLKAGEKDEASSSYINASKAFKKGYPQESVDALSLAVGILSERGRFQAAATNQKQIAEIYEVDLENFEKSLNAYELAAEWFSGEDSNAQASACQLKAANLAAHLEQYQKAIEKFEQVAKQSMENNLTKWSVRDYLLKAGICILCTQDYINARQALDRYRAMDMTFEGTREFKLLNDLLDALENQDVEQFTNVVFDFDKMTKLDNWKTTLLLRVKKSISDPSSLEDFT